MTREDLDFIGSMNMCDEISNDAYKKIVCHCEEQEPCEMTAEEYRQRMIQAFHNAECGELIAVCVLPTEKEFEHLEWLLKNHYKKEPCEDAIDRQKAIRLVKTECNPYGKPTIDFESGKKVIKLLERMSPVTVLPAQKFETVTEFADRCRECGAKYSKLLLEREFILDKIKVEIEELDKRYVIGDYAIYGENCPEYVRLWDVLPIIDKYKAESEG